MSEAATSPRQCVAILGGSFDPVHNGHVAIARTMADLLSPTQVRIIPSGWSWQKKPFRANTEHRLAMLLLAFKQLAQEMLNKAANSAALVIDQQEIKRAGLGIPSYSVDTLIHLRNEFGPSASLVLVIGADQLQHLNTWKNWRSLFDLAHIVVVGRPGFDLADVNEEVGKEFKQRAASIELLRNSACGQCYLYPDLAVDVSSTQVRSGEMRANMPPEVLDYIRQHHLY